MSAQPSANGKLWTVRIGPDFLDAPLSDRASRMFLHLESFARDRPYCWPSNEALCEKSRKPWRTVQEILRELEADGWIHRPMSPGRKKERVGIVLLRRAHPDQPAADTPVKIRAATDALLERGNPRSSGTSQSAEIRALNRTPRALKSTPPERENPRSGSAEIRTLESAEIRARNKDVVVKDALNQDSGNQDAREPDPGKALIERQRSENPENQEPGGGEKPQEDNPGSDGKPEMPIPPPVRPVAPLLGVQAVNPRDPPPPPRGEPAGGSEPMELAPSMRDAIATLSDAERAQFETLSPARRRQLLEPFRLGPDPFFLGELRKASRPPEPTAPEPVDTRERLRSLGTSRDHALPPKCAASLCLDFEGTETGNYYNAYLRECVQAVGDPDYADMLVRAYDKAMGGAARNRGAIFAVELKGRKHKRRERRPLAVA